MKPYIVKFYHIEEGAEKEEMFIALHSEDYRGAMEKYVAVTGGEYRGNYLISVTGKEKIEAFWNRDDWKFYTIPND